MIEATIIGVEKISEKLKQLPPAAGAAGVEQATNYLLGVIENREIPPYQYIGREVIPWASEKQRRFVMMKIAKGEIVVPYKRGGKHAGIETEWHVEGSGMQMTVTNSAPGVDYVYGPKQAKRLGLIGWPKIPAIIDKYKSNIYQSFMRGVKKAMKDLGLQ